MLTSMMRISAVISEAGRMVLGDLAPEPWMGGTHRVGFWGDLCSAHQRLLAYIYLPAYSTLGWSSLGVRDRII